MSAEDKIQTLLGEFDRTRILLLRIEEFYDERFPAKEKTPEAAIILSEILGNYYTCMETLFLRVSQTFENHLNRESWHRELLSKMVLEIPGERAALLSEISYQASGELLRFRHFKRYYLEFDYDWDRLELVEKKFAILRPSLKADFDRFAQFLKQLLTEMGESEKL